MISLDNILHIPNEYLSSVVTLLKYELDFVTITLEKFFILIHWVVYAHWARELPLLLITFLIG